MQLLLQVMTSIHCNKAKRCSCASHKEHGRTETVPTILNSGIRGGEWSDSGSNRFTSGESAPGYSLSRRLGGPYSRSGSFGKEENLSIPPAVRHNRS